MCFSFEASVVAFIIGEVSGYLLFQNENSIYKVIGLFVMWYSLVQLAEAFIYKNYNVKLSSKMLLFNLFTQGIVLVALMNRYTLTDSKIILGLMLLIAIYGVYKVNISNFSSALVDQNCVSCGKMYWPFLEGNTTIVLGIMYSLMFYMLLTNQNKKINDVGKYFLATYILSYMIPIKNAPSVWCYSSALVAPYLVYQSMKA